MSTRTTSIPTVSCLVYCFLVFVHFFPPFGAHKDPLFQLFHIKTTKLRKQSLTCICFSLYMFAFIIDKTDMDMPMSHYENINWTYILYVRPMSVILTNLVDTCYLLHTYVCKQRLHKNKRRMYVCSADIRLHKSVDVYE